MTDDGQKTEGPPWTQLVSDIRRQLKAFEIMAEGNPHLSSNLLIQNLRKIMLNKDRYNEYDHKATKDQIIERKLQSRNEGTLHDEHGLIISNWDYSVESFEEMHLKPQLLKAIKAYGYEHPSCIQKRVIVPCMNGWDVIAQAKSNTGRTSAVVIGTLHRIDRQNSHCQALVVTLTHQSAKHILGLFEGLGAYLGITTQSSIGVSPAGINVDDVHQTLKRGVQVFVGTSHEVDKLLKRRVIRPDDVEILVIDDAERLLQGGLKTETYEIMETLSLGTQIVLMSAQLTHDVYEESKAFMRHPVSVWVKDDIQQEEDRDLRLRGVWEFFLDVVNEEFKLPALEDLMDKLSKTHTQALIFCNTVEQVDWLTKKLKAKDYVVSAMHGYMDAKEKESMLKAFAWGNIRTLISTAWLTIGLEREMSNVPLAINYDFPTHAKVYIPRMGLGRRFGLGRVTINFVSSRDQASFDEIQKLFGNKFSELPADFEKYLKNT